MRYKNIIFDFGNVIGKFKGDYILGKFASTPEDYNILAVKNQIVLKNSFVFFVYIQNYFHQIYDLFLFLHLY